MKRERPGLQMQWSSLGGSPSRMWGLRSPLSEAQRGDAESIARGFLKKHRGLFRLGDDQVDSLRVARRYRTEHNGLTHVTMSQQVNGIPIFQAEYAFHVDGDGAIVAASGELIPEAASRINATTPRLTAEAALRIAAREVDEEVTAPIALRIGPSGANLKQEFDSSAGFGDHVPAELAYFPLAADEVRLAWRFIIPMRETPDLYFVMIDAERGSLLFLYNLTCYDENPLKPHGLVYTKESPRPNLPRAGANPPEIGREDFPFQASPFNGAAIFNPNDPHFDWWAGAPADNLISNNTSTYLDRDATANQPDAPRLSVPDGNFSFPVDLTQSPTIESNQKAAQANLFYWTNRYHDILYSFGFNEAAGNFQSNNFGLGGSGGDPVLAEAQDGSGTNNANFGTPPDGRSGRMQMFLWSGDPQRDGDFDQGVIIHELTHGTSNRLIGNATGLGGAQGGGMGEGWSDWFALVLLAQESDDLNGEYAVGQYVGGNYTRGIRRYPYSTSKTVNPLTFQNIRLNTEVHAVGEIWCNALWEVRAALIQKYGFREGQRQAIRLVVDGMKLSPISPTFVDARNAILTADRVDHRGENQCLLWQAFAKRGLGFRAQTDNPTDGAPVESLENAPYCSDTGILALDKGNYVGGELLKISLGDRNATGAVAVQLSSSATGDQETLTLAAENGQPGSFLGSLRVADGRAKPNDGVLQGSADLQDAITIRYNDPNNGNGDPAQIKISAAMTREKIAFGDTIEQGNQGWIPTGSWAITAARAASGTRSWTDSPGGNYENSVNTSLTSPLLNFIDLSEISISFAHSFDTEARFDLCLVESSIDDGATWTRAAAFSGQQGTFTQAQVSLRSLDGQKRGRVRFRLFTDNGLVGDGWYIDDIRLTGRANNPGIIPSGSTPAPVVTSISPAFGPPAGGTGVTIQGDNFTEDETTEITFDGLPATGFKVISGTVITATTPAHAAGAITVRVINRNGATGFQGGFSYFTQGSPGATPAITTLFPNEGAMRGGTAVTLIGSEFTPDTEVAFGNQKGTVTFVNPNVLRVTTSPATAPGAVEVAASNGPSRATLANGYTYVSTSPPTVQLFNPDGGQTLYVRSAVNINWRSSDNRGVARHRIMLVRGTTASEIAADLSGSDQSYAWTIPSNIPRNTQARIRVIATDGEGAESEALSSSEFTITQRWENMTQLPVALQRNQIASDGKLLYSFGGRGATSSTTTVATGYRFDPGAAQPTWTTQDIVPMPTGLSAGEAVFFRGKIYIPGGTAATSQILTSHFAYDPASNAWANAAATPAASILYALAPDETRGVYYLTGGSPNGTIGLTTARSYDPAANAWAELTPMTSARFGHEAALIGGKLYVAGGLGTTGTLNSGEVYDFDAKQWSPIAPLNRNRYLATSFVGKDGAGNPLWFVIGGVGGAGGALLGAEVYDVRSNRWIELDNSFAQNLPRAYCGGAVAGDQFYAVGGANAAATSQRATERTPIANLTLVPLDQSPVLAAPATQIAVAGIELKFTVTANDLGSGAPVTITPSGLPSGAVFSAVTVTNNSTVGTFRWTPSAADSGQTVTATFTASDGQLSDVKTVAIRIVAAGSLTAVNAADFRLGSLAVDSIAAAFGANLAVRTEIARELPLPVELAGTTVTINGIPAPLFFVSKEQINFAVPAAAQAGPATIIVSTPTGIYAAGTVEIAPSAPALFTLDASGSGDAAATATADGITFQPQPFDVTVNGKPNILLLFGTGFRRANAENPNDENGVAEAITMTIGGQNARVLYAGAQGAFTALDQINVEIPPLLAGQGQRRVEVVTAINGQAANRVTIQIR